MAGVYAAGTACAEATTVRNDAHDPGRRSERKTMKPPAATGEVFVSFSSKDVSVGKLFSALEIQNVKVWDYSAHGQELPVGHQLSAALKEKIEACEYFIALISPNSIDPQIGTTPIFEVQYALSLGKLTQNRLLPLVLGNPPNWLEVYPEFKDHGTLWHPFDHENEESFENTIRQLCEWVAAPYVPSSLRDPRAFFRDLLLREIEHPDDLPRRDFVKLILESNNFGRYVLNEEWSNARESITLLMRMAMKTTPPMTLRYALVLRGICELQLNELETAEKTFVEATSDQDLASNPLLGLGYAGLGHTYAAMRRFDESLTAFRKALDFTADDYLYFSYQAAIISAGSATIDESVFDLFDEATLTPLERLKVLMLRGAFHYQKHEYGKAIEAFRELDVDQLDEDSATFYALALQENGEIDNAIAVLCSVANRTNSIDIYHYLADAYWIAGDSTMALDIYETHLCTITMPTDYARQLLVEYARRVRTIEGSQSAKARQACERAVDLKVLAPPQSKADFFFAGFAHHLLGKNELARYFFDNSSGFSNEYYDEIP